MPGGCRPRAGQAPGRIARDRGGPPEPLEPAGNIGILTEHDAIVLIYRSRPYGSTEWKDIRQRVPITWTECHLGGRRPWFRCTVYAHGRYCGRRVAKIYHAGDVFACRRCCGLAYASQQEPVRERGITTARKIPMRLGGGESVTGAFPEKPKGMHWRRYNRLRRRHGRGRASAETFAIAPRVDAQCCAVRRSRGPS
jgi:hypothetical protein